MDKRKWTAWCAVFLVIICVPTAGNLLPGGRTGQISYENRTKSSIPDFSVANYEIYPEELTDYYEDHLPFRSQMIAWNSYLNYKVFHESVSEDVITGKEGWLFYNKEEDGNPVMGYKGLNCFSGEHLERIGNQLMHTTDYLEMQGCEFVLFIVPDKERIYSEYMPDYYGEPSERYRAKELVDYLQSETDVRVVFPYDELMQYKTTHPDQPLYYHYDTHWNNLGAYIGAETLMTELGAELTPVEEITVKESSYSEYDLADLMNLRNYLQDDVGYDLENYSDNNVIVMAEDDMTELRYLACNADPRKIMVVRDSFTHEMAPYIAAGFSYSVMPRRNSEFNTGTQYDILTDEHPDILVYEISERYLDELLGFEL